MSLARTARILQVTAVCTVAAACTADHSITRPSGAIAVAAGDAQVGVAGERLAAPIVVEVDNASGAPAAGVAVTWNAEDGGAFEPATSITDETGRAQAMWTLGDDRHPHTAVASAAGFSNARFAALAATDGTLPLGVIVPLTLETYDGSGQTVHPDYVATPASWPAARRYLFITPYPDGNAGFENPSEFESADPLHWNVPEGVTNPIVSPHDGYFSDPDALYVPERNEVWLYFREVTSENVIRLTTSTDGEHWSPSVVVAHAPNHEIISPSVVRRSATEWLMWSVNGNSGCGGADTKVELRRSTNGIDWSAPEPVDLTQPGVWPWHIDVEWVPSRNEFWAVYNVKTAGTCTTAALFLATSADGVHWTTYPSPVLARGAAPELRDVVYRSTFAYDPASDEITFWYSGAKYSLGQYVWRSAVERRSRREVFATIAAVGSGAPAASTAPPILPPLTNFP
jgi:hypothetical protein